MNNPKQVKWAVLALSTVTAIFLSACNLGQNNVPEPVPGATGQDAVEQPAVEAVIEPTTPVEGEVTEEQEVQLPPTNTPTGELLPAETLGPITIDNSSSLRTQEVVTVRVRRGNSVSGVTCSWTLTDTGSTQALGTPTTNELDEENIVEDVYTFTPEAQGTYVISCQGQATTASGVRQVSATSSSFAVEAKAA